MRRPKFTFPVASSRFRRTFRARPEAAPYRCVATLFGYTHEEVKANFPESLKALGEKFGLDAEATFAKLVQWYDGYKFEENAVPVFNPVSVGRCLSSQKFDPYWFETGTPASLLKLMRENPVTMDDVEIPQTAFSVYEPAKPGLMSIFYQTGYLIIKSARDDGGIRLYRLVAPNFEVETAFGTLPFVGRAGAREKRVDAGADRAFGR